MGNQKNKSFWKQIIVNSMYIPGVSIIGTTSKGTTMSSVMPNFSLSAGFFCRSCDRFESC
jgi:hypothetical protein